MKEEYKISVLVIVRNSLNKLKNCLDSLKYQTLDGIEVLMIVSDELEEHIIETVEEYNDKNLNFTIVKKLQSDKQCALYKAIEFSKGEYITFIEPKDIVLLDGYEKMYKKGKEENADLVKGNIMHLSTYNPVSVECDLLELSQVTCSTICCDKIYHKRYIRGLDLDNIIFPLIPFDIDNIATVKEKVYIEGKYETNNSKLRKELDIERFNTLAYILRNNSSYIKLHKEEKDCIIKNNLGLFLKCKKYILYNKKFREYYLKELRELLNEVDEIYDNSLNQFENMCLYFILNNLNEELFNVLSVKNHGKKIKIGEKYFINSKFFKNKYLDIPEKIFEVRKLWKKFIEIEFIYIEKTTLFIEGLRVPSNFHPEFMKLILESKYDENERVEYDFQNQDDVYSARINIEELYHSDIYHMYIYTKCNGNEYMYRISKKIINEKKKLAEYGNKNKGMHTIYFTKKGNARFKVLEIPDLEIKLEDSKLTINSGFNNNKKTLSIYIKNRCNNKKIYFNQLEVGTFELKYENFLDRNSTYDFYYKLLNKNYRLRLNNVCEIEKKSLKMKSINIEAYETNKGNLSLRSK